MYKPGGTIMAALQRIQQKRCVLPALQREFVCKPEQIERLFVAAAERFSGCTPETPELQISY